jgi:DNA polymerase III sliding clamp (beta) subunit (PCNA family)
MKIEIAKADLEAALAVVSPVAKTSNSDLTAHVVFRRLMNDQVEVLSNSGRIGASTILVGCKVTLGDDDDGKFTIEAARLGKWIAPEEAGVITLEEEKPGVVVARGSFGFVKFLSDDPDKFPFWDDTFAEATQALAVKAKRLHSALSYVKLFVSDKDTTNPKLGVTEAINGALQATDKGALAVVTLPELKDSHLRLHREDLPYVLSFIAGSSDAEGDIEIKEHDRCLFFVRPGSVLLVAKTHHAFPAIALDKNAEDPHWWTLPAGKLQAAINGIAAAASKEDNRLRFQLEGERVMLSMTAPDGTRMVYQLDAAEPGSQDNAASLPDEGFDLSNNYLLKVLGHHQGESIRFGINPQFDKKTKKLQGGWVRFREDRNGDDYLTLLVWQR